MAAALIDGTPWPCDVARAGQGDRPSSVGKDGRSWGMVVPPGPAGRERWAGRRSPQRYVGLLTRGTPRPPGGNERGANSRPPTGRHHGGASPLSSPGKPKPPALFKRRGAGRTSPRAESPRPMRQARSFSNARTSFTRRLWPGRVNPTLGCQRQHQRPGGPATPLAAPNAEPRRPARVALPFPPVWRLPPLEQERRHLAVLVEDKPPQPDGPTCPTGRSRHATVTAVASGARCRILGSQSLPVSQGDLDGDCTRLAEAAPKSVAQGGRGLPRPSGGRQGPPTLAADTSSGRQDRARSSAAAQSTRVPGAGCTEATYGHGRSSAVAFDGTPAKPGIRHLNPRREPPTPTRGVRPRPSPRWMDHPGAPPRRLGSRPGRARPPIPPDEGRWWLGPLPR